MLSKPARASALRALPGPTLAADGADADAGCPLPLPSVQVESQDDLAIALAPSLPPQRSETSAANVLVFRVTHQSPSKLKRPMACADTLTSLHCAVRVYSSSFCGPHGDLDPIIIERHDAPDIDLVDFFSGPAEALERRLSTFMQWSVCEGKGAVVEAKETAGPSPEIGLMMLKHGAVQGGSQRFNTLGTLACESLVNPW